MGRRALALGIAALGLAVGTFSLDVARNDPSYWFAGTSTVAGMAFLAAGWALVGCGLAFWLRRPGNRFGPLLTAAGFAWFLPEWNNPAIGSSLAFTVGLCLYAACPPLVGHAVLAYPSGRLGSRTERGVVSRRLRGRPGRPRRPARPCVRPAGAGMQSVSEQPLRGVGPRGAVDRPQPGRPLPRSRLGARAHGSCASEARTSVECGHVPSSRPALATWGSSRPGSPSSLDRGALRTARRSDVSGSPRRRLSSFSPLESPGAGFGAAGHVRPLRSSSSISPSRLHPAASGTFSPLGRRSRPRPRLPAGHDRPTRRRAGPPGRAGRSPGTDETRPRRTSRGRAHARARPPRRRAARG